MILKIVTTALLALSLNSYSSIQPKFQIFDVKQERVIQQGSLTEELEKSILSLLNSSPQMYGAMDMNPKTGLILHVEFESPIKLSPPLYPDLVKEIYLFLEPGAKPKALMFFNTTKKFIVVVLEGDSKLFIRKMTDRTITRREPY